MYQASALYNSIYGRVIYPSCDGELGARKLNLNATESSANEKSKIWEVSIFPNTAGNQITLKSNVENENLVVTIKDLSDRTLAKYHLKSQGFIANLELSLLNGVYFITIENKEQKTITKKLLIAK